MHHAHEIEERLAALRLGPRRKPTLKTIAEVSGLAVATVSRALNDAPDIGIQTKETVRQIADQVGYVPNRAGVRLRTGRTNVISLVLSAEHDMMNHTARLISSVAGSLRDTAFHLNITPYFPDQDSMVPVRYIVETGSADAVILNQTLPQDPRAIYLQDKGFPFATHGRTELPVPHPYFDFDNTAFGEIAVTKLVRRGCKRIALIAPPAEHSYGQHVRQGAEAAAMAAGVLLHCLSDITSDSPAAQVRSVLGRYLRADLAVDGVICASPGSAMASVAAIEDQGRRLGAGIHLCAKEAIPFLTLFRSQIVTVAEDVAQAGRFLGQAAIQAIRTPDAPPLQGLETPFDDGT